MVLPIQLPFDEYIINQKNCMDFHMNQVVDQTFNSIPSHFETGSNKEQKCSRKSYFCTKINKILHYTNENIS